jgi:hypothetical protein
MKLVNNVACPTTKLEANALEILKYSCLEKDSLNPLYLPLADENICNGTITLVNELCDLYNESDHRDGNIIDWEQRMDGAVITTVEYPEGVVQEEVLPIPSNFHVLVAYYRGIGRYRKAAMTIKKYKKLV